MFTFSFSTAFAATDTEMATALANAKAHAEKVVNDYFDAAMKEVVKDDLDYTVAKAADISAAWALIDAKAQVMDEIAEEYLAEANASPAFPNYNADAATYSYAVFGVAAGAYDEVTDVADLIKEVAGAEALKNMYEADRTEILSAFDKVDYTVYSATEKNAEGKTYLEVAEKVVADAKEAAAELAIYKAERYSESGFAGNLVAYALPALKDYVATYLEAQKYTGTSYETGLYTVKGVPTADKVEADKAADAAAVASIKARVAAAAAKYLMTDGASKTFAGNFQTVFNYVADEAHTYGDLVTALATVETVGVGSYNANDMKIFADYVAAVADMEAYATKYAAEKDATGAYVRDAEDVQDLVDEYTLAAYKYVITRTYTGTGTAPDASAYKTKIANLSVEGDAYALAFAKEQYKAALANDLEALELADNYYALEAGKVQANYEAGVAKIEAATTPAKAKAAYEAVNLTKNIKDADAVDALCTYSAGSAEDKAYDAVMAYVTYVNTGKNVLNADYILTGQDADVKDAIEAIYGEAGARTAAERKAVAVDAAAVAAKLATVGALNEAKAAAEAAIKALPTTITEADKEAVVAAYELADDYKDMFGATALTNQAKLDSALAALKTDMVKNFAIAVSKADKKDLDAMKALQAEFDAANELVEDGILAAPKFDDSVVAKAITDIRAAELAAVKKLINNLPINVTEADKAQVEAARAAYDAFVEAWTDYEAPYNAAAQVDNFRELALAEAALGLNDNTEERIIASVESLKIKASSTKGKGWIKVQWKVTGDTENVEGYQLYKSTKAQTGYKKCITTTKTSFKNTKNIEAGTRYYYKVRAFVTVDGVKYYSDWSNKANRVAK